MPINVSQSPRSRPPMSCFVHNLKIYTTVIGRGKKIRKKSHIYKAGIREFRPFFHLLINNYNNKPYQKG